MPAMISINVASYNGNPFSGTSAIFDAAGGGIGRAEGNRLVLAEPDQTISRIHAEIVFARDRFLIVNRGVAPIGLNGRAIESGQQHAIAPADQLQIGAYVLIVADASASPAFASTDFAGTIPAGWDLLGTAADETIPVPGGSPSSALPRPTTAMPVDPFGAFGLATPGPDGRPAARDANLSPVASVQAPPALPGKQQIMPAQALERRAPEGAVLSWLSASGDSYSTIMAVASPSSKPDPAWRPPAPEVRTRAPMPPAAPARAAAVASPAGSEALSAAWREGLGADGLPDDALRITPALLRVVGRVLREATQGTVDLLAARTALKREIRAEMTMIAVRENNPLKFSASVDIALGHLLGTPAQGFLSPEHAMRDAYEDLRAHQFATLAGMRAALEGIFARFDPAVLEGRLAQKSMVESLLPAKRKARMWEVYNEMYKQLETEASDDFHELFGKAFLQAYEDHIAELSKGRP